MKKILIVEDELNTLNGLVELFHQEGYCVFGERSATGALHVSQANEIDILISDYCIPDFSGIELVAELRRKNPYLQCFLMTAFMSREVQEKALRMGVRRVFAKPLVIDDLLAAVAEPLPSGYVARAASGYALSLF